MEAARPAVAADAPRLAELNRLALAELASFRGGTLFASREARPEPFEAALTQAIDDPSWCVLSGTVDDVILGYAVARVEDLRTGQRMGVIEDLYVEPEARGVGVGECLMGALLTWLKDERCSSCDAYVLPGDRSTKNFFEASGFTARLLVMHHILR